MSFTAKKSILRIIGFILSILLTSVGILLMRRQDMLAGVIILGVSLVALFLSVSAIEKNPLSDEEISQLKPNFIPAMFFIIAVILTGMVITNVTQYPRTTALNHLATAEWLLSMLSLTIGILWVAHWRPAHPRAVWTWIKANRVEFILASAVILAGLILRMADLTEHPYPWSGDEASIGMEARRLLIGDNTNLFSTGWSGQPNVSFLPTWLSMLIFGQNFFAIKMVSVLTGTLSILTLYLLAREWFSWQEALIASGFMVAFPFHLQFSRMGVDNIFDSLMITLVLWLIFRAVRTKSLPAYLVAGIASGFTIYTYVGTRLVLALVFVAIGYIAIRQKGYLKNSLYHLLTYLAGLLITAAPMAVFFIQNPGLFMTRIGQEGIFQSGWLTRQVEQTGQSVWQILWHQFSRTVLVFFAQEANGNFLNFNRPYLTILGAIFFVIGIAISLRYLLDQRYLVLQVWFWSVLTLGGFLTISPPANTRLLMTIPAVCLFIALGMWRVSQVLLKLKFTPGLVYAVNILLVLILAVENLSFYFGSYRAGNFFQDANGEVAMETGLVLQTLGPDYDYYLFGAPRVFAGFPTTDFLVPGIKKVDLRAESIADLLFDSQRGAYIVAIPENRALLHEVADKFPGGSWEVIGRKIKDEVLFYAYTLSPEQIGSP